MTRLSYQLPNNDEKILFACEKHALMIADRWKRNGHPSIKVDTIDEDYDCQLCPPPKVETK